MIKIIDGKRYNTDTATEIATYCRGFFNDNIYIHETLYRTPKGAYFLDGEGGPESRYANERKFKPLTEDGAFEWLQRHDCIEAIEKFFGDRVTDA